MVLHPSSASLFILSYSNKLRKEKKVSDANSEELRRRPVETFLCVPGDVYSGLEILVVDLKPSVFGARIEDLGPDRRIAVHVANGTEDGHLFLRQEADLGHPGGQNGSYTDRNGTGTWIAQVIPVALPAALFGRSMGPEGLGQNPVRPRARARAGVIRNHPVG